MITKYFHTFGTSGWNNMCIVMTHCAVQARLSDKSLWMEVEVI